MKTMFWYDVIQQKLTIMSCTIQLLPNMTKYAVLVLSQVVSNAASQTYTSASAPIQHAAVEVIILL